MAPLKNLERENRIIDADFRNFCASHGIFSAEDFLLHDLYVLVAFAEQQKNADRLKEGITQMLSIIDSQCRPWLNGVELLEDALCNKYALSSGNIRVDSLLQGGFREGQLTELVGPSSSGKTQVCMQAAASVAAKHMGRVLYLDTGNSFSPGRISNFIGLTSDCALNQIMSRISCNPVYDVFAMLDVLQHLEFASRSQINMKDRLRLLIVDSISSLITPILGGGGSQGRAMMVAAGYLLKKLAHERNMAVLVTNHTVAGEGGISKPALGETWKSIPHLRLRLFRDHGSNHCNMSILKHTSTASGKSVRFVIQKD